MLINEIFTSIDGEVNKWGQGIISTFIRMSECNLNCSYCDTDNSVKKRMNIDQVIKKIKSKKVTITGGEPLLQISKNHDLLKWLKENKYYISVETNGTFPIWLDEDINWIVDYKLEFEDRMIPTNYVILKNTDWVKIIIRNEKDFKRAIHTKNRLKNWGCVARFAFSPVFDKIKYKGFFEAMIKEDQWDVVLNTQIHKILDMK